MPEHGIATSISLRNREDQAPQARLIVVVEVFKSVSAASSTISAAAAGRR